MEEKDVMIKPYACCQSKRVQHDEVCLLPPVSCSVDEFPYHLSSHVNPINSRTTLRRMVPLIKFFQRDKQMGNDLRLICIIS